MMRLLKTEFHDALEALKQNDNYETWKNETCRTLTIATGKLALQYPCRIRRGDHESISIY